MFERTSGKKVYYYYDSHPTEEDLMGEAALHVAVIRYLADVLTWLFHRQVSSVHENLNFYQTDNENEHPIAPDIAVIKGVPFAFEISWRIGETGPAPHVVFEIASESTWERDLDEKPGIYARIGVQEYYAFDPYEPPLLLSFRRGQRFFSWQRDARTGLFHQLAARPDGSFWSPCLNSFLKPDGKYLCLYDRFNRRRLTQVEAETHRAEAATRQMQVEARRAEEAIQRAEELAEKLRMLGIDPDRPV